MILKIVSYSFTDNQHVEGHMFVQDDQPLFEVRDGGLSGVTTGTGLTSSGHNCKSHSHSHMTTANDSKWSTDRLEKMIQIPKSLRVLE